MPSGEEFQFPEFPKPENLTPAEMVKYKGTLRADNKPIFKETVNKSRGLKETVEHLNILDKLNEEMPEGVSRLLVDKEGNIRPTALKFKAVPKSYERFVKTVMNREEQLNVMVSEIYVIANGYEEQTVECNLL